MLKRLINHALIEFTINPLDPLLIKSGRASVSGVDMAFVTTFRHGSANLFIPGSSLKGVMRSYAEKICRSLRDNPVPVCLPYLAPDARPGNGEQRQQSCGLRLDAEIPTDTVYRLSCPACRLFGSHNFVGRLATADAYLTGQSLIEKRDGISIDRLTGGVREGPYDLEVLVKGEFSSSLEIRNFERWQLGLIGLVLRDMEEGLVRLGFGKSRGLGRVELAVTRFEVAYFNQAPTVLSGLDRLSSDSEREQYGFFAEQAVPGGDLPPAQVRGLRHTFEITTIWKEVLGPAVADLAAFITQVDWPSGIEEECTRRSRS